MKRNWVYEREVLEAFYKWECSSPAFEIGECPLSSFASRTKKSDRTLFKNSLSFITGGPGVGKTFTASHLIHSFLTQFPTSLVGLLAPTGKAVANLQSHFLKFKGEVPFKVEVYTLHKLFSQKIYSYLPYDLILVDESSMIDLDFMRKPLIYAKPQSRLIFLGDPHQLPPIESGFIFQDLLLLTGRETKLRQCVRSEDERLIEAADYVKMGEGQKFLDFIEKEGCFFDLEIQKKEALYQKFLSSFPRWEHFSSLMELLKEGQKFKVLSPVRKGPFGVDQINQELKDLLGGEKVQPIIIVENDYQLDLYNGDTGVLIDRDKGVFFSRKVGERFYDQKEQVRIIPKALLPRFEYAYCLSVHKSQGSEYERVSILLPPSSEVFGREMLYTAITRSKKSFEIFSDPITLKKVCGSSALRFSGVQAREFR